MNLATQAILHTCLQDAYSLFWCKEATVAEHIDIVGQSLGSHCRQHLVDNHIYIVTLTMASRYGMGTKKSADDRDGRRLLDASDDAQHLHFRLGGHAIAALDFHRTRAKGYHLFEAPHGIPMEYRGRQEKFVDLVIDQMIPQAAAEGLADYIDVFCDAGFFTVEDTERMLEAGARYGMRPKIHANEMACSGGIQCAVKYNALSCDHLEYTGEEEIQCLLSSETMPTVLPGAAFFLNMQHAPVRRMMEAGLPVAMASDYNPGSSPSGNMQLIVSFACVNYRMLPEEAINATTINSGYAMGVSNVLGSIAVGKRANFYITTPIPTYEYLPYAYGENKVARTFLNGKEV